MPEISRFYGIVIAMFYDDHNPPHFHAFVGDSQAVFSIQSMKILKGNIPRKSHKSVIEWGVKNRERLLENWYLSIERKPLIPIPPLK